MIAADAADQRPARLARGRDRPLVRPGADAQGEPKLQRRRSSRRRGSSGCSRTTTRRSRRSPRTSSSRRRSATRSTTSRSSRVAGPGRDPGAGDHPVDVPRRAAADGRGQAEPAEGEGRARRRRASASQTGHARVPERPDDQRRAVRHAGAEGPGEPPGRRLQHRALGRADWDVARRSTATARWRSGSRSGARTIPDPADYLAFTPGQLVGLRAGWPKGSDPAIEKLAAQALRDDRRTRPRQRGLPGRSRPS